jgi:hypothetical protein
VTTLLLPGIARCRSCGAEVRWVSTKADRRMPLDAWPSRDGNVQLVADQGQLVAEVLRSGRAAEARARGLELFRSHFATCPNADAHRRRS